jgi:hypothetical protein
MTRPSARCSYMMGFKDDMLCMCFNVQTKGLLKKRREYEIIPQSRYIMQSKTFIITMRSPSRDSVSIVVVVLFLNALYLFYSVLPENT